MWYPTNKSDLDISVRNVISYTGELAKDHPGYKDINYKNRRLLFDKIVDEYAYGYVIPKIEYTECENNTWTICIKKLIYLYDLYAVDEYAYGLSELLSNSIYSLYSIPQLQTVNEYLMKETGWEIRPVKGLLSTRDFINAFAHKTFFCTPYIRHQSSPFYTPEPDIIHELIGHIPLLINEKFSNFLVNLGKRSLGVNDDLMDKIGKIYWYSVEFGLCKTKYGYKIYGAGILSSVSEIEYVMNPKNEHLIEHFDPNRLSTLEYPFTTFQNIYTYINNYDELYDLVESFFE